MGLKVVLAENEPINLALRRLKKLVDRSGTLHEVYKRRQFRCRTELKRSKRQRKLLKSREVTYSKRLFG